MVGVPQRRAQPPAPPQHARVHLQLRFNALRPQRARQTRRVAAQVPVVTSGAPGAWLWWPWSPWRLAMLVVVPAPGDVEVLLFIICLLSAVKLYLYL